jgi:thiol-disulfide isomerase/thioredoxin
MSMMRRMLALAGWLVAMSSPAFAASPPRADVSSFAGLKTPLPYPYDEAGDADPKRVDARLARAAAQARREHKLLLVDLGGNWCGDCRILAGTLELPNIRRFVDAHYVVATVDTGRMDKNLQVPGRYGVDKLSGVPSVLVIDPSDDRLVNQGHVPALADARHMSPQALADWLAQWTP